MSALFQRCGGEGKKASLRAAPRVNSLAGRPARVARAFVIGGDHAGKQTAGSGPQSGHSTCRYRGVHHRTGCSPGGNNAGAKRLSPGQERRVRKKQTGSGHHVKDAAIRSHFPAEELLRQIDIAFGADDQGNALVQFGRLDVEDAPAVIGDRPSSRLFDQQG